jgi:hypothetical protein
MLEKIAHIGVELIPQNRYRSSKGRLYTNESIYSQFLLFLKTKLAG